MKRKLVACLSSLTLFAGVQDKAEVLSFIGTVCTVSMGACAVYEAYNVPRNLIKMGYKDYNKVDLILDMLLGINGGLAAVKSYQLGIHIHGFDQEKIAKYKGEKEKISSKEEKKNINDEQSLKLNETPHSS